MAETLLRGVLARKPARPTDDGQGREPKRNGYAEREFAPYPSARGPISRAKPSGQRAAIDLDDVQGLVLRGYGSLPECRYVLLQIRDPLQGRAWLRRLVPRVSNGLPGLREVALQVAFTHVGLEALGLADVTLQEFSPEFIDGITGAHRSRFLGDIGPSAPERWSWGGPNNPAIHVVLMVYANTEARLVAELGVLRESWQHHSLVELHTMSTAPLASREHFGFADGISQPAIEGYHEAPSRLHLVKPGEFLLGYPNEYGMYTDRPRVDDWRDPAALLPLDATGSPRRDLGRNGTYLVFRQLRQDVVAFRATLDALSRDPQGTPNPRARERLAAQMVGRWPSGASLIEAPGGDDASKASANEFRYHDLDPDGLKCPIGAHVRRANPRDALAPKPGTENSLEVNRRHRLIRRGRSYGPWLAEGATDDADRGLMFIVVNANISRQFEFVQHSWLIDPRFNGLTDQADPLISASNANQFVVPADPVRRRCSGLPRFVTVAGGGYFFLPGIRALHYLAESMP
jgi:Dyp-type peroxidase family